MREIRQLLPYQVGDNRSRQTVISMAAINSLTLMDMIMALEDRFDVSIPIANRTCAETT